MNFYCKYLILTIKKIKNQKKIILIISYLYNINCLFVKNNYFCGKISLY
jgi:hypothetical protein